MTTTAQDRQHGNETVVPSPHEPESSLNPFGRIAMKFVRGYSLVLLWVVMIIVIAVVTGRDPISTMVPVFSAQTPLIFLALAVVCTMAVGEFDLSFAGVYAVAGATAPALVVLHGWEFLPAAGVALLLALLLGLINGLLVVRMGINSVVVTLAVSSVASGLAFFISGQTTVSGMPSELSAMTVTRFLGLPLLFWYGLIAVAVVAYVMSATPLGRSMLFVGSNRNVARLAGISVTSVRMGAYLTSALLCGIAGVLLAAGLGGFNPATTQSYLMPAFAAVFLGTVAVAPGRFNPVGMLIGAFFLLTGVFGLQLLGMAGWVTEVFYGVVLVVAVALSSLLQRRIRA